MTSVDVVQQVAVVAPRGDLCHVEMGEVARAISDLVRQGDVRVVLDLRAVDHVNFTILPALVNSRSRLRALGGDLCIAAASDYVIKIFRFAGVHEHFQVYEDLQDALDSFAVLETQATVSAGQSRSWVPKLR